ncbi:MAG: hypothetical protein ACK46X_18090, partial [Candidatus Sericytochromatia bacterium]
MASDPRLATLPVGDDGAIPQDMAQPTCEPSHKEMGVIDLTLDKGVECRAYGTVYALDYTINEATYAMALTIDYYN